ncbi:hypothetical protein EDD17DRAFT_346448 [Pisolithus thermaeus]|nr:hypothetical protein EDD17DRAFT_346448 [Pisolithus thermaeus]
MTRLLIEMALLMYGANIVRLASSVHYSEVPSIAPRKAATVVPAKPNSTKPFLNSRQWDIAKFKCAALDPGATHPLSAPTLHLGGIHPAYCVTTD